MGQRVDELEHNITQLMQQVGPDDKDTGEQEVKREKWIPTVYSVFTCIFLDMFKRGKSQCFSVRGVCFDSVGYKSDYECSWRF